MANAEKMIPRRHLQSLDALRGLAALVVVLFHWIHFQYDSNGAVVANSSRLPLWSELQFFYLYGDWAVTLFFSLSGFIFFYLYGTVVAERRITPVQFMWLRFSRLYPLHLFTLIYVAACQSYWHHQKGSYYVYEDNTLSTFGLQLALASGWSGAISLSYNAPAWSLSIEVLLYALFFIVFTLRLNDWQWSAVICIAATVIPGRPLVSDGIAAFFAGGLSYRVYSAVTPGRWLLPLTAGIGLVWWQFPWPVKSVCFAEVDPRMSMSYSSINELNATMRQLVHQFSLHLLLFPATVAIVAWWDRPWLGKIKIISQFGCISYSSYMLHFPLQMTLLMITESLGMSRDFYCTSLSLLIFYSILIAFSLASYHWLECPAQRWLRSGHAALTRKSDVA
jgi:peptidoglycan/LPS O-acetylase OafA/YrhL